MGRGRISMFGSKTRGARVVGVVSQIGAKRFETQRKRLAAIYVDVVGVKFPLQVSDADVVEFLARGVVETRTYLLTHNHLGGARARKS